MLFPLGVSVLVQCLSLEPYPGRPVADLEILKGGFVGTYTAHRRRWCAEP